MSQAVQLQRTMHQTTLWGREAPPNKKQKRSQAGPAAWPAAACRAPVAAAVGGGSSFVQCPICNKHVLLTTSDDHVVQCLAQNTATVDASKPADGVEDPQQPPHEAQQQDTSKPTQSMPLAPATRDEEAPPEPARVASDVRLSAGLSPAGLPSVAESSTDDSTPTTNAATSTSAATVSTTSVLSAMMRSARTRTERQSFCLTTTGVDATDWQLRWKWTRVINGAKSTDSRVGEPSGISTDRPRWEGKFTSNPRKGAGGIGRELTIRLSAFTDSSDEGENFVMALARAMASAGRHTLSPSQLKSALQKNVRLSRPEEAIRCAAAMVLCPSSASSAGSTTPLEQFVEGLTQLVRRYVITTSN